METKVYRNPTKQPLNWNTDSACFAIKMNQYQSNPSRNLTISCKITMILESNS